MARVSVDGTATVTEDGADAQIDALAFKYLGKESYPWRRADQTRVSVSIAVERVDSVGLDA